MRIHKRKFERKQVLRDFMVPSFDANVQSLHKQHII